MSISLISNEAADSSVATIFSTLQNSLGLVPNMARVLAQSPAALQGWVSLNGALQGGQLPAALRERIALALAERNQCHYCLAAHTALGSLAGLDQDEQLRARLGTASDAYADTAVSLALAIVDKQGALSAEDHQRALQAGLSEAIIVEITAHVALNILTNFVNNVSKTPIDFPQAPSLPAA